MTRKQLIIIATLLGLALILYAPSLLRDRGGGGSAGGAGFVFDVPGTPTRIDIVRLEHGDTIRLEGDADGWTVDGRMADSAKVSDLLAVIDSLRATDLVARNPANHGELGVADSTGRLVAVWAPAGGPAIFHLGNRDLRSGGYYARAPGDDRVFRLDGPAGGYLTRERDGWRERTIAEADTAAVREIMLHRDGAEYVLQRADSGWRVGDATADTAAVGRLLGLVASLEATGFPPDSVAESADFTHPDAALDVFSADSGDVTGRTLALSLRLLEPDDGGAWLVRRADGSDVYELSSFSVERLVPTPEALRAGSQQ
ncbi:MAG: DUF4340 domain-containing protein [Gemmatimonadota bacterium]